MKTYILKYSSYSDSIFNGNDIEIKSAYFSGIKFGIVDNIAFIYFDTITVENRPITLTFRIDFEDTKEWDSYFVTYNRLFIKGMSTAINIPSLLAVSCFYKQTSKLNVWYSLYAIQTNSEEEFVYKLTMNRNIFYQIMFIINKIRHFEDISESNISLLNKFNYFKPDVDLVKLSHYSPTITIEQKLFCHKPGLFDKEFTCHCMITFIKESNQLVLCFPVKLKITNYKKHKDKFIYNILDFNAQMEHNEIPTYYITDGFPAEYSLSADTPMSKFVFLGMTVGCSKSYKYFNIPEEMFAEIGKLVIEYIKK